MSRYYRTILATLGDAIQGLIDAFKTRVSTDSGTFEGESYLKTLLQGISGLFTSLVVLTPNAWKVSKLYTILQNDGTTDFDFVRATGATRVNESGLIESVGNNIPRIDWFNGKPQVLIEPQRTNLFINNTNYANISERTGVFKTILNNEHRGLNIIRITTTINPPSNAYLNFTSYDLGNIIISMYIKCTTGRVQFIHTISFLNFVINTQTKQMESGLFNPTYFKITEDINGYILFEYLWNSEGGVNRITIIDDVDSQVFVGGYQVEQVSTNATSTIITNGSTVTRNADVATLDPPAGTTEIIETLDGVDNTITTIPTTYQLPEGRVDKVVMK